MHANPAFFGGYLRSARQDTLFRTLFAVDFALVVLHILRSLEINKGLSLSFLAADVFALDLELSLAEHYQTLKFVTIAGLFFAIWLGRHHPIDLALATVFAVFACDDYLGIHERLGFWLSTLADSGASEPTIFEAIVLSIYAVVLGSVLWLAALATSRGQLRAAGVILLPLGLFAFFAGGVDAIHTLLEDAFRGANLLLTILEDAGEMVAITLALVVVFRRWTSEVANPSGLTADTN